ncbi:MAG: hypothetical protein HY939_00005 [Gammaproteobacteria bacterium]|nr:hypothetical protein [Gammaproteobacteria bacterium]
MDKLSKDAVKCAKCILLLLISTNVYAEVTTSKPLPADIYIGGFAGGGSSTYVDLAQHGTALYSPGKGGPLSVNAYGKSDANASWIAGAHIGYKWAAFTDQNNRRWNFVPAAELEAYYLGNTLTGNNLNNETDRLAQHDFRVSFPMHTGVFLANAVLNVNHATLQKFHPYVGVGVGTAIISISGANSTQTTPAEPGINHYNSDPNASAWAFAAQPKIGVSFELANKTSLFVEYRFLYLSPNHYTFGSTQYSTHVGTTDWNVTMGPLCYNMGTIGIQFDP